MRSEDASMEPQVRALARSLDLVLPIALGGDELSGRYKVSSLPTTVIVGTDGAVARILIGGRSEEELARLIDQALAQAAGHALETR